MSATLDLLKRTSPRRAREHAAANMVALGGFSFGYTGSYEATKPSRLNNPRTSGGGPHDMHLTPAALWTLRETSRELERNSTLVRGAIERLAENVIHAGYDYRAATGDDSLNADVDAYMDDWYASCDTREEFHFWDLAYASDRNEVRDGDTLYHLDPSGNDGRGSVAIIEGDRLVSPTGVKVVQGDGSTVYNGIHRTKAGAPIRYWIADEAPPSQYATASEGGWHEVYRKRPHDSHLWNRGGVLHCYYPERYTGTRGTPWFAACIREVDDLDGILVAERVAMRLSANRANYTRVSDPEAYAALAGDDEGFDLEGYIERRENSEPGEHHFLPPGAEAGVIEHNRPGDNFQAFLETELRLFGLPAGLPIELVLLDFSRPNFAAQRLGLQVAYRKFMLRQVRKHRHELGPIRNFAIARGIATGDLPDDPRVYRVDVGYPRWPYIDPLKDANADIALIDAGLKTREQAISERGSNPRKTLADWEAEKKKYGRVKPIPGQPDQPQTEG